MSYAIKITGPGVDFNMLIADARDFELVDLVLAKIRKQFPAPPPVIETSGGAVPVGLNLSPVPCGCMHGYCMLEQQSDSFRVSLAGAYCTKARAKEQS